MVLILCLWSSSQIGGIAGSFCCGIACDILGRRLGRHSKSVVCSASAVLSAVSVACLALAVSESVSVNGYSSNTQLKSQGSDSWLGQFAVVALRGFTRFISWVGGNGSGISFLAFASTQSSSAWLRLWLFLAGFGINGPKTLLPFALVENFPSSLAGSLSGLTVSAPSLSE